MFSDVKGTATTAATSGPAAAAISGPAAAATSGSAAAATADSAAAAGERSSGERRVAMTWLLSCHGNFVMLSRTTSLIR